MPRHASLVSTVALALSFALAACGGGSSSWVRVSPMNAYRGYDDFQPAEDKAVLARSAAVDPAAAPVRIFQEAFPEGVTMSQGVFGVRAGYRHHLLGKFAYSPGKAVPKTELVARVKKLAIAAGGDAAIVIFLATDAESFDLAQGIEAIILKVDPRMAPGGGELPPAQGADGLRPVVPAGTNAKSL